MHILLLTLLATTAAALQYSDAGMLCLVNKERRKHGLKALGLDPKLTKAAYSHSKDQARMRKMSHSGSDGSKASSRVERAGFNWRQVGENVAYGYRSMEEVMKTWMNSPGHRANILGKQFTMFGSGYCTTGSTTYFTQDFGDDGKGVRNVPKCDGSDYGNMNGGDNYPSGNQSGGDYGSSRGGRDGDYGSSNGGGNDYGSSQGGRGGRRGGRGGRRGGQQGSGSGRGGNDYGSSQGGRGGRRGGKKDCPSKRGRRGGDSYGSSSGGRGEQGGEY